MSSITKQNVLRLKKDLLNEHSNYRPDNNSDERILDMLNRLDELDVDLETLKDTLIGKTLGCFKKKKSSYPAAIVHTARALEEKWKRVASEATTTEKDAVAQVKVEEEVDNGESNIDGSHERSGNEHDEGKCNVDECDNNQNDKSNVNVEDEEVTNIAHEIDSHQTDEAKSMFCDICSKPAKFREFIGQLQTCKDCGISVHELCYCMVPTETIDPNFTCHACKAVNTTVEVNVPSRVGGSGDNMGKEREQMFINERPTECVLCLAHGGYHAMHPLYDTWGKEGRQLVLKATRAGIGGKPRRLAWVHTLCAQMLAHTKGYLYGVDQDGDWHGFSKDNHSDEDEGGEESNSRDSDESDEEVGGQRWAIGTTIYKEFPDEEIGNVRFFQGKVKRFERKAKLYKVVYDDGDSEEMTESQIKRYLHKPTENAIETEPVAVATRNFCINEELSDEIKEARKLRCVICHQSDRGSLRIPTQCNAGDLGVHAELEQHLGQVSAACTKAMHVGCARWNAGRKYQRVAGNKRRMTYFYPGKFSGDKTDDDYPDPVAGTSTWESKLYLFHQNFCHLSIVDDLTLLLLSLLQPASAVITRRKSKRAGTML